MKVIAYLYIDPLLEDIPQADNIWGLEVDEIYQDIGGRQQLEKLLGDCRNYPPNYLLIRRLDELGDSVNEVSDRLIFLEGLAIEIIATEQAYSSTQFQSSNGEKWRKKWTELVQEMEHNKRCRRLQQGHAKNRLQALPPPGKAPYGYRRGKDRYILDRSTAPVVKDFFERFLLFGSLRGAVRYLEKKYGKKISVSTGHSWLNNPVYRGDLVYQKKQIIPNTHAAILSREEAAQIDRLIRRNSKLAPRTASAPRSLAGLVFCQECQSSTTIAKVVPRNKKKQYLYLRPKNCPYNSSCKAISYKTVLEKVINRICQDLPSTVPQLNLPDLEGIKDNINNEIKKKKDILEQLPILNKQGILDGETVDLRRYKLQTEIAQLQEKFDQLPPGDLKIIAQAVSLPQFWLDLSEAERRFYFREFIAKITINFRERKNWEVKLNFIF